VSFEGWKFIIGTTAALCTTMAFVPQILKIRRSGGRDLSYPMLALYLGGVLLWLGYGLMIRAQAIILANAAASLLVSACIALKWVAERSPGVTRQADATPEKLQL
jgi:MtN3 and saliva related transmembrane protein